MTAAIKEPQVAWTAPTIPGLVKKKKADKGRMPDAVPEKAPVPEPVKAELPKKMAPVLDVATAHEELMECLRAAQVFLSDIGAASDAYYIMCDYVMPDNYRVDAPADAMSNILRAISDKNPTALAEVIEVQADKIVEGWQFLQTTATKAVDLCSLLAQNARGKAIEAELHDIATRSGTA